MTRMTLHVNLGLTSMEISVLAPIYGGFQKNTGISREDFYNRKFRCLWLLHGTGGDNEDWLRYTQIELWAEEKNVFVICPYGGEDFYVDGPLSNNWESEITKEVWDYLHILFPLMSDRPEDNIIAGLSMGGYGAMYYALRHPDKFGFGASLSGGLNFIQRYADGEDITGKMSRAFGPKENVLGGPYDMYRQADDLAGSGKKLPRIYMACGTEDWEYEPNKEFRDHMISLGYDLSWDEGRGYTHEWRFWNIQIEKVLNWAIPENFCSARFTRGHAGDDE